MPPRKQGETLEQQCFMVLASLVHRASVEMEEQPEQCRFSKEALEQLVSKLPAMISEQMVIKVIETIHLTVATKRRAIGLRTCLEILLQRKVQKLDLSGLFFKFRLPGVINTTIRTVVSNRIGAMRNLTSFNMVSKCNDEILRVISKHCPQVVEIIVSISDLVTDKGIQVVAIGCKKLERLGIYKCWEVTPKGIELALMHAVNLKELQSDQLGSTLINKFRGTNRTFKLTHFEQTQNLFEPTFDDVKWVGQVCKDLEFARLYIDDDSLVYIHELGSLKSLELELPAMLGPGFLSAVTALSESLTTLQLSCDSVSQEQLTAVGYICRNLTSLHITTATIEEDRKLVNNGEIFQSLTFLHLQVWKEAVISAECVEFFLLWCRSLTSVVIKAEMGFLTHNFLKRILSVNPLQHLTKLIFASDKYVPLTVASAHYLIEKCPLLEILDISSWDVSEEEFFELVAYMKKNNYNFTIT